MLIQSNLESLPAHTMQCFELPKNTTTELDRINREFFWKKSSTEKGLPMVNWDKICRPKVCGGLGLRKAEAVNKTFMCKLAWKILKEPRNWWVQQMRAKYTSPAQFFGTKIRQTDSCAWKCILRCRNTLKKGIRWRVGDGKQISFWYDNWCANDCLANLLPSGQFDTNIKVYSFITTDRTWDVPKLQSILPNDLVQIVRGTPIPSHSTEDTICWGLTSSGDFSTKSATWLAHGFSKDLSPAWDCKWVWKINVPPKLRVFLWQICHKGLSVRGELIKRGMSMDPCCPLCQNDIETLEHLFFDCPSTASLWNYANSHNWISNWNPVGLDKCCKGILCEAVKNCDPLTVHKIVYALWSIWKGRNGVVFKNEIFNPIQALIRAKSSSAEWRARLKLSSEGDTTQLLGPKTHSEQLIRWDKPAGEFIKINFDGSKVRDQAAGGFVIRNWRGHFIQAGAFQIGDASITVAEAIAVRNGVQAAVQAGFKNIHIEGDSKVIIQALRGESHIPWVIHNIIVDVRKYLNVCRQVLISHIYQEGNRAADWMAHQGHSAVIPRVWASSPSRAFSLILHDDFLGRTLVRRGP